MKTVPFRVLRCAMPGVHAVEACSAHSFPRHTHDQFGIGLIREGAQRSLSGRGMVEAGPGMMITVNAGEVHDGMPIGDSGRRWSMLYFDPEVLHGMAIGLGAADGDVEFHHPVMDQRNLSARFESLYRATTHAGGDGSAAEELALLLFDRLVPARRMETGPLLPGIARARAMIDGSPARATSLAELAELCGASRFRTMRAFARATGLTPHAYILQKRLDLARRLIAGGMPLAQAAAESGFFDQSHMTRHFARVFGVTPGAYAAAMH